MVPAFSRSSKRNVIAKLQFELVYSDVTVHQISQYSTVIHSVRKVDVLYNN